MDFPHSKEEKQYLLNLYRHAWTVTLLLYQSPYSISHKEISTLAGKIAQEAAASAGTISKGAAPAVPIKKAKIRLADEISHWKHRVFFFKYYRAPHKETIALADLAGKIAQAASAGIIKGAPNIAYGVIEEAKTRCLGTHH